MSKKKYYIKFKIIIFYTRKRCEEFYKTIKRKYNSKSYLKFYKSFDKFVYNKICGKNFYGIIQNINNN